MSSHDTLIVVTNGLFKKPMSLDEKTEKDFTYVGLDQSC